MRKTVLARDLMRHPVRQLTAWTPVSEAAAFLQRQGISGAPVIDEHGRWVGVFTQNDLARWVRNRLARRGPTRTLESREGVGELASLFATRAGEAPVREAPVRDFMTAGLYTVFPEATLEEVVRTMAAFDIHRVFVIEEEKGDLLGIITTMDVLRWMDAESASTRKTKKIQQA
jgi:CBS domain-containing protein